MKTAEEWQKQLGYRTVTNVLNPFGYSVPRISIETIRDIQSDALQEAAKVVRDFRESTVDSVARFALSHAIIKIDTRATQLTKE